MADRLKIGLKGGPHTMNIPNPFILEGYHYEFYLFLIVNFFNFNSIILLL